MANETKGRQMIAMQNHWQRLISKTSSYAMLFFGLGCFLLAAAPLRAAEISNVSLLDSADGDVLLIKADQVLNYEIFDLTSPPRLVLSFPGSTRASDIVEVKAGDSGVLRVTPVRENQASRLSIALDQARKYRITENGNDIVIHFAGDQGSLVASDGAVIKDIEVRDIDGVTELRLRGERMDASHNAFMGQNNGQLILDFWGGSSKLVKENFEFAAQRIKDLTVGAADGRVRLVVNLVPSTNMQQQIDATDHELVVRLGSIAALSGKAEVAVVQVEDIKFQPDDRIAHLTLRTDVSNPVIDVQELEDKNRLVINLQKAQLKAGLERTLDTSQFSGPIRQIDSYGLDDNVRVVVRLRERVNVTSFQQGNVFTLNFEPVSLNAAKSVSSEGVVARIPYTGQKVTFDFKDIEISNALKLIAEVSDLNIIMTDDVKGKLTMRLIDVPWDQAFELILTSLGLGKEQTGNVVRVAPTEVLRKEQSEKMQALQSNEQIEPLMTEFISLNYAKADDVKNMLDQSATGSTDATQTDTAAVSAQDKNALLSPRGSFLVDIRTNTLIVKDTQTAINNIKRFITTIDLPVKQVLIESRIVEATDSFQRNIGIRWGGAYNAQTNRNFPGAIAVGATGTTAANAAAITGGGGVAAATGRGFLVDLPVATAGTGGAIGLSLGSFSNIVNLDLELSAAELDGDVHIVSNPRIVTTNLKEATIKQGIQLAFVTPGTANSPPTTTFSDALLELKVTPQITANDSIIMDVNVKKDAPAAAGSGIDKKEVNTNIHMRNGETVVIGGVYTRTKRETVNGVPGLSSIPVLGWLFKNKGKQDDKTELLIFLTPKILGKVESDTNGKEL